MVAASSMPATGGLFKSPFPTDAAPPAARSSDPRAQPSVPPGAGGEQRPQRPDLEVDWSHLERERAALAAQKARREGGGREGSRRGGEGPLIGENEVGRRDRRDHRPQRDERAASDRRASRYDEPDEDSGYDESVTDEQRAAWRERARYQDDRHVGARGYDDRADDEEARDTGYGSGYTGEYMGQDSQEYPAPYDEHDDDSWAMTDGIPARDERVPAGEQFWEPSGGLWSGASASDESGYLGAPPAAGRAPGKAGQRSKGAKAGKQSPLRLTWLIGTVLSSVLVVALVRFELQHSGPTATATTGINSARVFSDTLLANKNGWLTNVDCVFKADGYHLSRGYLAYAPVADATNFDMTVRVTQAAGTVLAPYGLVFRRVSLGNYYVFGIDGNGKWTFYKSLENVGSDIVVFTANPAIKQGLNAQNTLEVRAQGTHFTFLVNGTEVGQADDSSLTKAGELGVAGHDDIEVVFTAFALTRLP